MDKVILIGGSPTAGKSYTARRIAEELRLPWISTDIIREQMRWIVKQEDYPNLFKFFLSGPEAAVDFLNNNTAEEIVADQNRENLEVWKGIVGVVEGDYVWKDFIVEGVAIIPQVIATQKWKSRKDIRSLFLIDENRDRVRATIFQRGLWDEADKYSDEVKDKEVEWVFAYNEYIKSEARKYELPVVSVDRTNYITEIKRIIS